MPTFPDGLAFLFGGAFFAALTWVASQAGDRRRRVSVAACLALALVSLVLAAISPWDRARAWAGTVPQVVAWALVLIVGAIASTCVRRPSPPRLGPPDGEASGDRLPLDPVRPLVGVERAELPS